MAVQELTKEETNVVSGGSSLIPLIDMIDLRNPVTSILGLALAGVGGVLGAVGALVDALLGPALGGLLTALFPKK